MNLMSGMLCRYLSLPNSDQRETARLTSADIPEPIEIEPSEALARLRRGAFLIDVREDDERALGMPLDAVGIARAGLDCEIEAVTSDRSAELLTICASGQRSLTARDQLLALGYRRVMSVQGGFVRWKAEGLPVAEGSVEAAYAERYARHLVLPEVGIAGQKRLSQARVAMVGAGGLGSPVALYLAAAGVGTLTLIDDDKVERSNLQRQVLHVDARVGMAKTESARIALGALNPTIRIQTRETRVVADNVETLLNGHDLVIDGADNFPTRYLLDAACRRLRIPMVYAAVHRFSGQVSVFDHRRDDSPCYRCLFPEPPTADEAPNCSEAGVLGVLPGVMGMMQATEAIKVILGQGRPLVGRLLCFDALEASFRELHLSRDPACPGCGINARFTGYEDIAQLCHGQESFGQGWLA
jgi:sulfur-carrier protein adenylyltransferase/sulfurtransferase